MRAKFAYHVFSHDGTQYRTTRSGGVSSSESRALEQFIFGQTNDPGQLASLEQEPGLIWRWIPSARALTRVRPGKPDSNNRATLRFETLLLTPTAAVSPDQLSRLVCGEWSYFDDRAEVSLNAAVPGKLHPEKISDILMNLDGGTRLVRQAAGFSIHDVSKIIAERAGDSQFSIAYKCFNSQAPVTVNLVYGERPELTMPSKKPAQAGTIHRSPQGRADFVEPKRSQSQASIVMLLAVVIALQVLSWWMPRQADGTGDLSDVQEHLIARIEAAKNGVLEQIKAVKSELANIENQQSEHFRALGESFAKVSKQQDELSKRIDALNVLAVKQQSHQKELADLIVTGNSGIGKSNDLIHNLMNGFRDIKKQLDEVTEQLSKLETAISKPESIDPTKSPFEENNK